MNAHASDPIHIVGSGPNALTAAALTFGTDGTLPASVLAPTAFTNGAAQALLRGCALQTSP